MKNLQLLLAFTLILTFLSCVSKKKFNALEEKVRELEARPFLDLTDTDKDGVIDMIDQEKDSRADCPVDTRGKLLDSDGDGVVDCDDDEPHSTPGYKVDTKGVAAVPTPWVDEQGVNQIVDRKISAFEAALPSDTRDEGIDMNNLSFKEFTLPAPPYSKEETFDIDRIFSNPKTFGSIDKQLSRLLSVAGFEKGTEADEKEQLFYYYQVTQDKRFKGFAVITAIEQIDDKGEPVEDRFNKMVEKKKITSHWWEKLFPPLNKGYFRFFAFLITSDYYGGQAEDIDYTKEEAGEKYERGAKSLKKEIAQKSVPQDCKLHVLVYEFKQREDEQNGILTDLDDLSVKDHLKEAKIKLLK